MGTVPVMPTTTVNLGKTKRIVLEIAVFQHCMVMVTVMMATMDMMARINNSTEVMDDESNGYGYDDMNGGEYDSEISDESDSENCNANGESCTDNFDCCSSACDMNSCVG